MKKFYVILTVIATVLCLSSCKKDGKDQVYYRGTVTLRQLENDAFYMKQDDTTALIATNIAKYPYPKLKEARALISFTSDGSSPASGIAGFKHTYNVTVIQMDTIHTKKPVPSKGTPEADAEAYGNAKVGIYLDGVFPPSMIEDGYLCVSFMFRASGYKTHEINLVTGVNNDDPYEVELRHNTMGDGEMNEYTGIMNFPLSSLPDTGDKEVNVTLKWNSVITGKKESTTFKYKTRRDF